VKGKGRLLLRRAVRARVAWQRSATERVSNTFRRLHLPVRDAGALAILGLLFLAACSSSPPRPDTSGPRKPGGYYLDDGPGVNPPANLEQIADPQPRVEPIKASTSRPYTAFGRTYTPMTALSPYQVRGTASWYGKRYHGQATASGEPYDMYAMTAAHPTLPIPSYARVTNLRTGRSVVVRINDRGPFHGDRVIDLSYAAAYTLGMLGSGSDLVEVQSILPDEASPTSVAAHARVPVEGASAEEAAEPAVAQEATGVYVQLGAFSLRANAESFLARLRVEMSWLSGAMGVYVRDGLYRVHAGPYPDRAQADDVARRIEQSMDLKPILITR
jgi:rare lipoprotein A